MNITEKSKEYSKNMVMETISSTIEKAYADGFADGYREAGIRLKAIETFSLESDVEYVDLHLPSGTLWSSTNVQKAASFVKLPYIKAEKLNIPTEQQFRELFTNCRIEICQAGNYFKFTGTNGEHITIVCSRSDGSPLEPGYEPSFSFWLKDDDDNTNSKNHAWIGERAKTGLTPFVTKLFMGIELPVMLVL